MQRDLILRWLEQIRALVARLLHGDRTAEVDLIENEIDGAVGQLLGTDEALFQQLEPEAIAALLNDPFRIYGYAQLIALRSAVLGTRGVPPAHLARLHDRALRLARIAVQKADPVPPDWRAWLASLEDGLPSSTK
jgi:hypothetical protein